MRPLIGITSFPRDLDLVGLPQPNDTVPIAYTSAVRRAGGAPLLVPIVDPAELPRLLEPLDALVLSGGGDIDPARYGAADLDGADRVDPVRDGFDAAVVDHVLASPLPVLAVCRGLQVLNVGLGGTLHPHVPGHRCRDRPKGTAHDVDVAPASRLAEAVGSGRLGVNSLHHQTVDRLGSGLRITGRSTDDGEVEAVELEDGRPVHGVQWHPELLRARDEHLALFARLVEAAGS